MSCSCLHFRRQPKSPMLYDNLAITATTAANRPYKQTTPTKSHIERRSDASIEALRPFDDSQIFEKELEKYSTYRVICEDSPSHNGVDSREGLLALLGQHLQYANEAQAAFEKRGKIRRAYQKTTEFLSTFKSYVDAYGGVVDMMASAGGAYGHTAYSTMSIFLTIAANKQDRDERIMEVLKQLCRHYSRFPTLERIHPTQEMKQYLAEAYTVGIDFARYASLYFLKSSIGRLWSVIYAPPERFDEELGKIAESMEAIKDETAFRDSERLYRVEAAVEENTARLEASQREIQDAQRDAQLESLRQKVLPDYAFVTQETSEYQARLEAMFDGQRRDIMCRLPELRSNGAYRGWETRAKSSILVLRGEARQETHFSWFSPLIMALCREFQRAKMAVAFQCCQPRDTSDKGHQFVDVLNHLSFQLLYTMTQPLESESFRLIRDILSKPGWGRDPTLAMNVLREIIRGLDSATLIVDRADLIRGDWEENLGLLCSLASKKISKGCVVKIILLGSRIRSDWRDVEARLTDYVGPDGVFELNCAEGDWDG